ncbi:MAG: lactate racemase domain-containing protein [Kiritimatiellaeota bacterium]|nr:lactate racemase domain-containing protein [Kiritimatiellota bacterium]
MKSLTPSAVPTQLTAAQVADIVAQALPAADYHGQRVLLIVPDHTRTAPVGLLFKTIFAQIGAVTKELDVLVALGTHPPLSEEAICRRLELSVEQHRGEFKKVRFFNHEWGNPAALREIGLLTAAEVSELTGGLFAMNVPVEINQRVFHYDQVIIVGPVFPHEVVGFSGGNKYLFPGVGGPKILNFFHWLGAVLTNPVIIGNKWTPVRKVVDRAAALVGVRKRCFAMVVAPDKALAGLFFGTPETAWDAASELSRQVHILYKDHPFQTVLSCMPPMYDDLWVAGKGMYKLEPVVADGGELIIYAPHVTELSVTHGRVIAEIGYHCRDYFLKQWARFEHYPWGVLAHSTHVRGLGAFENGIENCRVQVTLATGIPADLCRKINLGYRDPQTIRLEDFANREAAGVLLVPQAGEMLYQLKQPPRWADGRRPPGRALDTIPSAAANGASTYTDWAGKP